MPVPSTITELSPTPGSNYPAGSESPAGIDDYLRFHAACIAQLRDGAYDGSDAVKLTGAQTIAGAKTFSSPIVGSLTGNAATATTATNVSRSVTGAGLATGGGALTADRTITVTEAITADAQSGTGTGVMTSRRTAEAIEAQAMAVVAGAAVGSVGSCAMLQVIVNDGIDRFPGATLAGAQLAYSNANGNTSGTSPAGTWRLLGYTAASATNSARTSLWVRVS